MAPSQNAAGDAAHGQVGGQLGVLLPEAGPLVGEPLGDRRVGGRRGLRLRVPLGHLQLGPLVVLTLSGRLLLRGLVGNGGRLDGDLWRRRRGVHRWGSACPRLAAADVEVGAHALGVGADGAGAVTRQWGFINTRIALWVSGIMLWDVTHLLQGG